MKNKKEKIENWKKRFDELFDSDVVCCNEGNQITHFGELELFKEVKPFIKELLKSEKEMLLERIEKEMEDWRKIADKEETPFLSLLNKDKAGFNDGWRLAINRIYNSWIKLKEEIKKEEV